MDSRCAIHKYLFFPFSTAVWSYLTNLSLSTNPASTMPAGYFSVYPGPFFQSSPNQWAGDSVPNHSIDVRVHSTVTMCLLLMELIGKQNSVPENYFNDLHGPVQPKLALDDMLGSRTTHYIVYHYHTPPSLMVQQQRNLELANNNCALFTVHARMLRATASPCDFALRAADFHFGR